MKMLASLVALAAVATLAAPLPAVAGRDAHVAGGRVVIVQSRAIIVARPASPIITRPIFLDTPVVVARPLFVQGPIIVRRPFFTAQPVIVQRPIVVPRRSFFFTAPGTVFIVR